jgi:hypothetical protein
MAKFVSFGLCLKSLLTRLCYMENMTGWLCLVYGSVTAWLFSGIKATTAGWQCLAIENTSKWL